MRIKKLCIGLLGAVLLASAGYFILAGQEPKLPAAVALFAKETLLYSGTRSPVKIAAALQVAEIESTLQEGGGLTEKESQMVANWLRAVRGVHFGFRSFTGLPFVLNATIVLEGPFEYPLTDILGVSLQNRVCDGGRYREIPIKKLPIPLGSKFSLELYISDPVEDRVFISFSKRELNEVLDRMLDGGSSLNDNPQFVEMVSLTELRNTDTLQYIDLQAYLNLLYDWTQIIPQPKVKALVDLFWKECRLTDYESISSGSDFAKQMNYSCLKLNPGNPFLYQFSGGEPLRLPTIPANVSRLSLCRLTDPSLAVGQLVELAVKLEQGVSSAFGDRGGAAFRIYLQELCAAAEKHPSELGALLTGELGFWQSHASSAGAKPAFCFYLGITDADAVKTKIGSIQDLEMIETNGICRSKSTSKVFWSVQPDRLLIANDSGYLQDSLDENKPSLIDTPAFANLLKKLPSDYVALEYANYEKGIPVQNAGKLPPALLSLLDLLKGVRKASVSYVDDGMLNSCAAYHFDTDRQWFTPVVKTLFSSSWELPGSEEPPFELSAEEAYSQSLDLLSAGRQIDAEELVDKAVQAYSSDLQLLFSKAVLERSRWQKRAAFSFFLQVIQKFPNSELAKAAMLCLDLDRNSSNEKLNELATLSDAHPENIYLLWLSAIQCREQKNGPLGRERYEKLILKFKVGPVLLHQTYANILEDYLKDYETALKHRYLAVSMEAKSWSLQGLARTLTELKQYDEACAVWARTVRIDPNDYRNLSGWGWTLQEAGRYEEALEKHREALRINPSSPVDKSFISICLEKLGRREEMVESHHSGAKLGDKHDQLKMGYYFHKGIGVAQDFEKAAEWYRLAADQGNAEAWRFLGLLYGKGQGVPLDYNQQLACYKKALSLDPEDANVMNSYAWMLAACKDKSFRDYPKAVELAERSVALDEDRYVLDTLAVAYDRNGQAEKAVETQERIIALRQKNRPGKPVPEGMLRRLKKFEGKLAALQALPNL